MKKYHEIEQTLIGIEKRKRYLNNLAHAIAFYREKLECPPNAIPVKNKVQSDGSNKQEEMLAQLADLSAIYDDLLPKVLKQETKVYNAISRLDMELQNILIEKYLHNQTWHQVAAKFDYSERSIYYKRDKALKKLVINGDFLDID